MPRGAGVTDNFGFLPSPYANINLIRDNLHDRYRDVYAIVKELVQNAGDAEATRLDIAWTRRLAGVDYPMLRGRCPWSSTMVRSMTATIGLSVSWASAAVPARRQADLRAYCPLRPCAGAPAAQSRDA